MNGLDLTSELGKLCLKSKFNNYYTIITKGIIYDIIPNCMTENPFVTISSEVVYYINCTIISSLGVKHELVMTVSDRYSTIIIGEKQYKFNTLFFYKKIK